MQSATKGRMVTIFDGFETEILGLKAESFAPEISFWPAKFVFGNWSYF